MIISHSLSFTKIFKNTWKIDLFIIVTCMVSYYFHEFLFPNSIRIPTIMATLIGTALAFFIGFNNSQAYGRWWEARQIWGALTNDSRSWARNLLYYTDASSLRDLDMVIKRMIYRHLAFVYALKKNLRNEQDETAPYFARFLSEEELVLVQKEANVANAILSLNAKDLQLISKQGGIDAFRFIQLNQFLTLFTDHMGKSERIRNTVFPTYYLYFTRLFIWALVVFCTLLFSETIGAWSIFFGWIIGFIFHVTHQNGLRLLDPFDNIPSGIPLNQISRTIEINLLQMMDEKVVPEPVQPIDGEYVM